MSQRILVVEDNDRNRRLLKILLRSRGYELEAVRRIEKLYPG